MCNQHAGRTAAGAANAQTAPQQTAAADPPAVMTAAATREAFRLLDDACLRGGGTGQLAAQLRAAGALDSNTADNPVALYSQRCGRDRVSLS